MIGVPRFTLFGVPCLIPRPTISRLIVQCSDKAKTKWNKDEKIKKAIILIHKKICLFELIIG